MQVICWKCTVQFPQTHYASPNWKKKKKLYAAVCKWQNKTYTKQHASQLFVVSLSVSGLENKNMQIDQMHASLCLGIHVATFLLF